MTTTQKSPTLPPAAPEREGAGGGRWAWLMTAAGAVEAELVRGRLEGAGVPVALDRRNPSPTAWLFLSSDVRAPVQVLVPAGLLEAARLELLEAGLAPPIPSPAVSGEGLPERRAILPIVAVLCAIAVASILVALTLHSATCMLRIFC